METAAYDALRQTMERYHPLCNTTWHAFQQLCHFETVPKDTAPYPINAHLTDFGFIYRGLMRAFTLDEQGNEYNKIFFTEHTFPGAMVALLTDTPSDFEIATIEETQLIRIDFKGYRQLLYEVEDLKCFHIHYLEQHWLLAKEPREVSLVQDDAATRYENFLRTYPNLETRLKQYHIASHLGITPTQLSRIRRQRST